MPINPCRNCVYYPACGSNNRKKPCDGRKTASEVHDEMVARSRPMGILMNATM